MQPKPPKKISNFFPETDWLRCSVVKVLWGEMKKKKLSFPISLSFSSFPFKRTGEWKEKREKKTFSLSFFSGNGEM